jgi:ribonuclease P protein component
MFAKDRRLQRAEFNQYFADKKATRIGGPYHTLMVIPGPCKVSVVAGKKVAKRAVVRNRLRRQAYGTLARLHQASPLPNQVYIVIYKPGATAASRLRLDSALNELLARTR